MLVGLDWAEPMMQFLLHVTCSYIPIHTYSLFNTFCYILAAWDFSDCFFLPLSLSFVCVSLLLWHLNTNLPHHETLFVLGHPPFLILLPLTSGSMMRRPNRTSLTLTYSLSFTVGVESHCVTSWSLVYLC